MSQSRRNAVYRLPVPQYIHNLLNINTNIMTGTCSNGWAKGNCLKCYTMYTRYESKLEQTQIQASKKYRNKNIELLQQ